MSSRRPKANATVAGGVYGESEQLSQLNHSAACPWQQGLSHAQIRQVYGHRRTSPDHPLPAHFQRDLGRSWCAYAVRRQR